jgi:tryptophan synthase beta chain
MKNTRIGDLSEPVKILLDENEVPRRYYNIAADLQIPPPIHPDTREPLTSSAFEGLFARELARQEFSKERNVPIPDDVREALLRIGRPTPLVRARRLEEKLGTSSRIYFKNESLNPCGSHKPNTAIAQAYYNTKEGIQALCTETGAGQWGTALSYACMLFGLDCQVFMVRSSLKSKPLRSVLMRLYGATVNASPSKITEFGRKTLAANPEHPGSLGVAISEAIECVAKNQGTKYALGSVLNHVLMHQTVIGLEVKKQLEKAGEPDPDFIVGCIGGGSNFAGLAFPFVADRLAGKSTTRFVAAEPTACPSITKGRYEYDFGDTAGTTPLLKMYTLGKDFIPPPLHAGGLRYHGKAPAVSALVDKGIVAAVDYTQERIFEMGELFARTEGIVAAPESCHAIAAAVDLAVRYSKPDDAKTIIFNLSGHGLLDLAGYDENVLARH